jgi:hypothetical protein
MSAIMLARRTSSIKKPVDDIISIQTLARSIISIFLQQPNSAYGSPGRTLKTDYDKVFNENYSRDLFVGCILIQRQVDKYLGKRDDLKSVRSIIRFYVSMTTTCALLKKAELPTDKEIATLVPQVTKPLDESRLKSDAELVLAAYAKHGATETVAKGGEMRNTIVEVLKAEFSPKHGH